MGKKEKRVHSQHQSQRQQQSAASSSTSASRLEFLHKSNNKVAPDSGIPSADVLSSTTGGNKKLHGIQGKGETGMDIGHYYNESLEDKACQSSEEDDDTKESGNEDRRKLKKERQKERKRARKMAAKRKESEVSLGDLSESQEQWWSSSEESKPGKISLCRRPITTLEYFFREIPCLLGDIKKRCAASRRRRNVKYVSLLELFMLVLILAGMLLIIYFWITTSGPVSAQVKQYISWYSYWIFLGILSSVGLGTGLHTFILYLGPFIAKVSLAAEECSSLDFPQPPYPNQITCPTNSSGSVLGHSDIPSILDISIKVCWETLAWGFGTALGELPPYFIARAASLAGDDGSGSDALENQEGFLAKVQLWMRDFVMKVGFWGILLCASIPNPLFDLAGITCGHFQVPFAVFFGATAIGKTVVKSQLQMTFVILAFNEKSLGSVLSSVENIPKIGHSICKVFTDFIDYQRAALHNKDTAQTGGVLKLITEIIVLLMILYFVASIINGMARSYHKRISSKSKKKEKKASKEKKRLKAQT